MASMVLSSFGVLGLYLYAVQGPDPSEQLEIALRLMNKGEEDAGSGKGYKSEGQQNVSKVTDLMNMRTHHSECT